MTQEPRDKYPEDENLGHLETDILRLVWQSDRVSVRDVYERLRIRRDIAYTTVMTVMTRLYDKGFLDRDKIDRAYLYRARESRLQVANRFMRKLVSMFFDGHQDEAFAALLDVKDDLSVGELEAMKRKLAELERDQKNRPKKK